MADENVSFVFIAATVAHILAIDTAGGTWWRRWDKKGWNKMENPTISVPSAPVPPAPSIPVLASIVSTPAIQASTVIPSISIAPAPHQDPA